VPTSAPPITAFHHHNLNHNRLSERALTDKPNHSVQPPKNLLAALGISPITITSRGGEFSSPRGMVVAGGGYDFGLESSENRSGGDEEDVLASQQSENVEKEENALEASGSESSRKRAYASSKNPPKNINNSAPPADRL